MTVLKRRPMRNRRHAILTTRGWTMVATLDGSGAAIAGPPWGLEALTHSARLDRRTKCPSAHALRLGVGTFLVACAVECLYRYLGHHNRGTKL